jgi:branched-chain amino acid transport system substrate-binding protein
MVAKITRRRLLRTAVQMGGGYFAIASPFVIVRAAWAQSEPIRVAMVQDMSKVYGLIGDLHVKGLKLGFESVGNEILGRKIEVVVEDTSADPAVALSKTKKVMATFKPHFFAGPISSSSYAAIKGVVSKADTVWLTLTQGAGAEDTVLPICSRNVFSLGWNNWQLSAPFAGWAYEHLAKEFWIGYANYNWGQGAGATFKAAFEKAGGKILGSITPPLGTADYAPFLSQLVAAKPPAFFCFFAGGDAVNFVKQWEKFGLHKTTKLTGQGFLVGEEVLSAEGNAALGTISVLNWALTLDTPANKIFRAKFQAKYKTDPAVYALTAYDAAHLIAQSVTAAKSTDAAALIPVIENMTLESPRGAVKFSRKTHEAVLPYYVRETKRVDGKLTNAVIANLPIVETPAKACDLTRS